MAGPLDGFGVVEFAGIGPAQLGGMVLSDLGADVIRVDRCADVPATRPAHDSTELLARGRRSIALDLKTGGGSDMALALLERADVLLDPYRPGVLERLGLGPDVVSDVNPRLLYARMTGWGQDGPLATAAGHDINYIALTGALEPMGREGEPPPVPLNLVADFGGGGMLLAVGVLAGLLERERSGSGQVIDAAMVDGVATLLTSILQIDAAGEWSRRRGENWVAGGAPWYRAYGTSDGRFVAVGPLEGRFYAKLLERLDLDAAEWPQWERSAWPELERLMTERFAARTLEEWSELLEGADVCFAPVLSISDSARHPHIVARGTYATVRGVLQPAPAPRFSRTPGAIGGPPPWPGQHTTELLRAAGLAEGQITGMLARGEAAEPA